MLIVIAVAPLVLDQYFRRLPEAPACPICRAITRPAASPPAFAQSWFPWLARTFAAECTRCGWAGRMRWRLAPNRLRQNS